MLRAGAFQDAHDRAGGFGRRAAGDFAPHQHAVAVHGRAGGAFGDDDFGQGRIVRLQEAFALAVDADAAGNEAGLAGLDVAVALGAEDLAVLLQAAEGLLQGELLGGGKPRRWSNWRKLEGV